MAFLYIQLMGWILMKPVSAAPSAGSPTPNAHVRTAAVPPAKQGPRTHLASWYGPRFHGRLTASGEVFDMYQLTAAHPDLPLGTRLKVTNPQNGKSVTVRINDRGPYIAGRELDLSFAAARELGFTRQGLARVRWQRLGS